MSAQSAIKLLTTKGCNVPGGTTSKIVKYLNHRCLAIFDLTKFGRVPYKVTYVDDV